MDTQQLKTWFTGLQASIVAELEPSTASRSALTPGSARKAAAGFRG